MVKINNTNKSRCSDLHVLGASDWKGLFYMSLPMPLGKLCRNLEQFENLETGLGQVGMHKVVDFLPNIA